MTKLKNKLIEPNKKHARTGSSAKRKKAKATPKLEMWRKEIDQLKSQQFSSLDEAIYSLIDMIHVRMMTPSKIRAESKKFLFDLLDSDDEIKIYLENILSIGKF